MTTTARPPARSRHRLSLAGIPVSTVIAVELIGLCGLLVAERRPVVTVIAIGVGLGIAVCALARRRRIRIGTRLLLRVGYLLRHRETLVAVPDRVGDPDGGTRDGADVAPEIEAFFPGMAAWEARTHDGGRLGVVQWHGACSASLRIRPHGGIVRSRDAGQSVPVEAIMAALDGQRLGLDSVQVLTQTIVGEPDPAHTPLLVLAAAELAGGRARVRNRTAFVTVRLDPSVASGPIADRGGGRIGIARVLAAAVNRIEAAMDERGLDAEALDAGEAVRSIAESFCHRATPYDPIVTWTESVRQIASARMAHRSFALADVRGPMLAEVPAGNVFAYALSTQARPLQSGGWSTRTVLRLTCRSTESLSVAARELCAAASRRGVVLQPLDAVQHLGMRATVPIGGI